MATFGFSPRIGRSRVVPIITALVTGVVIDWLLDFSNNANSQYVALISEDF